jgi:hypothetical protein
VLRGPPGAFTQVPPEIDPTLDEIELISTFENDSDQKEDR